jgi:transposase
MTGLNPQAYLADIIHRIADHLTNKIDELLPWNWTPRS